MDQKSTHHLSPIPLWVVYSGTTHKDITTHITVINMQPTQSDKNHHFTAYAGNTFVLTTSIHIITIAHPSNPLNTHRNYKIWYNNTNTSNYIIIHI